jgi:hypothetical protein
MVVNNNIATTLLGQASQRCPDEKTQLKEISIISLKLTFGEGICYGKVGWASVPLFCVIQSLFLFFIILF